jgi:hypothetical protein
VKAKQEIWRIYQMITLRAETENEDLDFLRVAIKSAVAGQD